MSTPRRRTGLDGRRDRLAQPSVGATENLMMAAALARGETLIAGAAREPEIVDLAACLSAHGRPDRGRGLEPHHDRGRAGACMRRRHAIMPDRIEAGTYAMAAAITGGRSCVRERAGSTCWAAPAEKLVEAGMRLEETDDGVQRRRSATAA